MTHFAITLSALTLVLATSSLAGCRDSQAASAAPQPAPVMPAASAEAARAREAAEEARTVQQLIAKGEHLVNTSGCHDCHTPFKLGASGPEPDMSRKLSGHPEQLELPPPPAPSGPWIVASSATNTAHSGPWGISFTANLTPDVRTGLGGWTKDTFIQSIRTGRHQGRGRPILPPMPVPVYRNFSDDELGAIFAYLQTIPAIENKVPDPVPPAPTKPRG